MLLLRSIGRHPAGVLIFAIVATECVMLLRTELYAQTVAVASQPNIAFLMSFGWRDKEPRVFDGKISLSAGEVVRIEGWRFDRNDKVTGPNQWRMSTRLALMRKWRPDELARFEKLGRKPPKPPLIQNGVIAYVRAPTTARVRVRTKAGEFAFPIAELQYGRKLVRMNGNVRIERVPIDEQITQPPTHDDYVSMTIAPDRSIWVAWIAFDKERERDAVFVRRCYKGIWEAPRCLSERSWDHYGTAIGIAGDGRVWVVWAGQVNGNVDLYARAVERDGKLSRIVRLTNAPQPDLFHRMVADARGRLWLVWQGFRNNQSDIFLKCYDPSVGRWGDELRISESDADDWMPAVAVDATSRVHIAWDTYERGNYDIRMRTFDGKRLSIIYEITTSPAFEAYVDIAVDANNRVWLVWNQAGVNWGKDTGFLLRPPISSTPPPGERLYAQRWIRMACIVGGKLQTPKPALVDALPRGIARRLNDHPKIRFDKDGRLWVFYRRRTVKRQGTGGGSHRAIWYLYGAYWDGNRWRTDVWFPHSAGRKDTRYDVVAHPDGGFVIAWASDERPWRNPVPRNTNVHIARMEAVSGGTSIPTLVAYEPPKVGKKPTPHPNEPQDIKRCRTIRVLVNGRQYRLIRGDTHRHTDISADGGGDGSLIDMYRYALDATQLDWISGGDHDWGFGPAQPYFEWVSQKLADMFHVSGRFVPMFGYERSVGYPMGHRNVTYPKRGVHFLPRLRKGRRVVREDSEHLFKALRRDGGLAFSHTSATNMGTDWYIWGGDVEPVVEIFQGCRTSYEYEGAPKAATADRPEMQVGGFKPLGFVWNAWAKGYRLGVIASSDHGSTHFSYASLWVDEFTRMGIYNALKQRHSFGATDNIILIYVARMPDGKEHFMGEEFETKDIPRLVIQILGTNKLSRVDVIKNNTFVYTKKDFDSATYRFEFIDPQIKPGTNYYYVRAIQTDGQIAWSSPIWVNYKP